MGHHFSTFVQPIQTNLHAKSGVYMAMVAILNSGYNTVQTCQILFYSNTGLDSIVVYTELPSGSATKTSLDCGWSKSHDCATLFSGNSQVQTYSCFVF